MNKKTRNDIIGVVYRHPNMDASDFTDIYLNNTLNKLCKEKNKGIHITGDFNFDLLKYSTHGETGNFYDKMSSNLFLPSIIIPTKINSKKNTLIDNRIIETICYLKYMNL